jgi:hypothetical protein
MLGLQGFSSWNQSIKVKMESKATMKVHANKYIHEHAHYIEAALIHFNITSTCTTGIITFKYPTDTNFKS